MGNFLQALLMKVGLLLAEAVLSRLVYELYAAYTRSRQAGPATA
ncbi:MULTISPECIES: hypothetical protein [Streptomyces]|nr:hypothetical protein [Streptomyces longispororuber]